MTPPPTNASIAATTTPIRSASELPPNGPTMPPANARKSSSTAAVPTSPSPNHQAPRPQNS